MWLCNPVIPKGNSRKLNSPWVGPYKVVKCISDMVYRIQDTRTPRKRIVVHFDRLKSCNERMRTQVDARERDSQESTDIDPSAQVQQATRQLPPGTNLQVRDDYEGEDDSQQDQEAAPQQQGNTAAADNQQRQYPHRSSRRRPARYRDD